MMRFIHKTSFAYLLLLCLALSSSNLLAQITTFAPNPITAGTTTVLTITGTGFGTGGPNATMYVEFRNADDGGATYIQPIASEYVSWSTTQILVRVPSDAGTGTFRVRNGGSTYNSATSLTIPYDLMNVVSGGIAYRTDHINKQAGGYTWQMFTGFDANAPAKASFTRALETWRCATFINWGLGTTTAVDVIAADGVNLVRFDKAGQELPPGVLGRCSSRWTSCSSGGTWEWWVYELDIEFDQAQAWEFGPVLPAFAEYDFESVALHELGHGHQLGHVNEPTADVMHYSISNGATRRALVIGDINGGLDVMAKSTAANLCTPAPMVALNSATCLLSCPSSPTNDAICSATLAPVNGTCVTSQTNVCSTGDITGGCMTSAKTVWYKYVVTAPNNQISITFPTSTFGGSIETALYSGLCGAPVFVGSQCGLPSDTYRFTGLAPGTYTYGVSSVAGLEGNFSICATQSIDPCVAPPANDAICSPVVLPVNGTCVTAQNNCPATADYNLGCAVSNKTLWYSLTLTGANDQVAVSFANTAAGFGPNVDLQLYSGACGTPVAVAAKCGTKTTTFTFTGLSAAGSPYRLGVSTDAAYTGLFDICATQSINPCTGNNPANDAICSARVLPVNATCLTSQTNVCATADYTSGCASSTNTVWYQFNLTGINSVMNVNFSNVTFGGGGNVEIILASGLCTTPTFVSTYCGSTGGAIRFTTLSTLTTYYLGVTTPDGNQGTFDICGNQSIDCGVSVPANDGICSAVVAPVNGTCLAGQTNVCATPDISGGCVTATAGSVYYSLTVTAPNNALRITFPSNSFSGLVQTYLFGGTCTTYTGVNSMCATAASTFTYTNLAPGTYFFMVATETTEAGDFTICATEYQTPPGVLTGPMQDCAGAIPMCATSYNESNSYIGFGNQELAGGTCLGTNESNSVWYSLSPQSAGTFAFNLSTLNDYDFAVYDLTSYTCADIPGLVPVRCNWSGTPGNTGLVLPASATIPLSENGTGVPTMPALNVTAGSRYVIVVDNYSADNNGYTLTFTGTAQIFDNTPPTMTGVSSCSTNQITLQFNEDISCDSLDANEFRLIDPITGTDYSSSITSVSGLGCGPGFYTSQVIISHNGSFPTSTYQLITNKGKIQDKCGNRVPVGTIFTFDYLQDILVTSNLSAICTSGQPVVITANGGNIGATYTLNPGGLTNSTNVLDVHGNVVATTGVFTVSPFTTTQYTVSTTSGGCTKSNNVSITLVNNVISIIDPVNVSICAGTTTLNASATVNGVPCVGCSFQWSGGSTATTPSITVGSGTYNVIATTSQGCPGTNTASSTVTVATAGATPNCNVYYVSPAGGGDGLTKGAPTTLQNAITLALCQTAIIKMQTGIYTFTDKIDVNSFVTIEGGYDATFTTKSSNMSGGTNSTTIRRTNATDSDNINTCTCFRVVAGANGFLFQDLRIEMPGSASITGHTDGLDITNYGIKLGAGCTGYNIVRCYIDAGRGSN